jgi:hypothetical protein
VLLGFNHPNKNIITPVVIPANQPSLSSYWSQPSAVLGMDSRIVSRP